MDHNYWSNWSTVAVFAGVGDFLLSDVRILGPIYSVFLRRVGGDLADTFLS